MEEELTSKVSSILLKHSEYTEGYNLNSKDKYLLRGNDLMLFEMDTLGVYYGHFFFESRGAGAVASALSMIEEAFNSFMVVLKGLVPLDHKGSAWLAKRVGGLSQSIVNTPHGKAELFSMTKEQWRQKWDS